MKRFTVVCIGEVLVIRPCFALPPTASVPAAAWTSAEENTCSADAACILNQSIAFYLFAYRALP